MFKAAICSGVIVLGLAGTVPDVEAWARRTICEEWRDYYYSVETGEFLGWAAVWGGSHGYVWGCFQAQYEAGAVCIRNQHTCEEAAGGCR